MNWDQLQMGKRARALLSRQGGEQMILARHRRPPGRKLCALADRCSCGLRVAYRGGADSSVQMPQGVEKRCQKAISIWRNEAPIVYGLWPRIRQAKCRGGKAMIWFDAVTTMLPSEISALAAAMLLGPGRCCRYIELMSKFNMTEDEKELICRYDITAEQRSVYIYKGYRYEQLREALNYAIIEIERQRAPS